MVGSVVFSLEYVLRLLTIHESTAPRKQGLPRGQAMMTWLVSAESIIDLLSFGPFFLEPIIQHALPSLGVLRVLRLVRVSSTSPHLTSTLDLRTALLAHPIRCVGS